MLNLAKTGKEEWKFTPISLKIRYEITAMTSEIKISMTKIDHEGRKLSFFKLINCFMFFCILGHLLGITKLYIFFELRSWTTCFFVNPLKIVAFKNVLSLYLPKFCI